MWRGGGAQRRSVRGVKDVRDAEGGGYTRRVKGDNEAQSKGR